METNYRGRNGAFFQVYFTQLPSAKKRQYLAIGAPTTNYQQELARRGALLICGVFPTSFGGMWLLKAKSSDEAEKMAAEYPPVKCNLVKYKVNELINPMGAILRHAPEPVNPSP